MPGLRSLVARRRSSLASPPCASTVTAPSQPNSLHSKHDVPNGQQSECNDSSLPEGVKVSETVHASYSTDHVDHGESDTKEKKTDVRDTQVKQNHEDASRPHTTVNQSITSSATNGEGKAEVNGLVSVNRENTKQNNVLCDKGENSQSQNKDSVILNGETSVPSSDSERTVSGKLPGTHGKEENKLDTKCDKNKHSDTGQCSVQSESPTVNRRARRDVNNHTITNNSAMEIESTLASRGVTVVRRMVDSSESSDRVKGNTTQNTRIKNIMKNIDSVTANSHETKEAGKHAAHSISRTVSLTSSGKELASFISQSGSNIQASKGYVNSLSPKNLFSSITSRGTLVRPGLKSQSSENFKGSSHLNVQRFPSSATSKINLTHSNLTGNNITLNRGGPGPGTIANSRGHKVGATQGLVGAQSAQRGYATQFSPRGPAFQSSPRGIVMQTNLKGPVSSGPRGSGYLNSKGPYQYSNPRRSSPKSNIAGMSSQFGQPISGQQLRPTVSQQSATPGLLPSSKVTPISPLSRSVDVPPHSRPAEIPKQLRADKIPASPQTGPTEMGNSMSLQSQSPVVSPLTRSAEGLSPQSRSVERSPQSRSTQMSPQTVISTVHSQSIYTGMSPQSTVAEISLQSNTPSMPLQPSSDNVSPQSRSVHPPQSTSAGHLPGMNMVGLQPSSSTVAASLPSHTASGILSQTSSLGLSPQIIPSALPHMVSSDRYSAGTSAGGFPSIPPSTEYLGRSNSESFPYSNHGSLITTTSTGGFSSHLNSGEFNMLSTSAGFTTQSNLVGYPSQISSCGFSEHPNSDFSLHNSGGVIGQTNSAVYSTGSSCSGFSTPVNLSGYAHQSNAPFNVLPNLAEFRESANEIMTFPGSVPTNSREFSGYSNSDNLSSNSVSQNLLSHTSQRSVNPSSRELALQNCTQEMSLPSNSGNSSVNSVLGGQYSQSNYGESIVQPTYRESPLNTRTNPGDIQILPDYREPSLRHSYRDTSVPSNFTNFREPMQNNIETSQTLNSYRNLAVSSNSGSLQVHENTRAQNSHVPFKEPSSTPGYREQDILTNYMETPVLPNFRDASNPNSCREQSMINYKENLSHTSPREDNMSSFRENVSHASPEEQIAPTFVEPVSHSSPRDSILSSYRDNVNHTSPKEQVHPQYQGRENHTSPVEQILPNFREPASHTPSRDQVLPCFQDVNSTSPREQVLPSFRENVSHLRPREPIHPNYQEPMSDTNAKQEVLPGFRDPLNYSSCREPLDQNRTCEQSTNLGHRESFDYSLACRESLTASQSIKPEMDSCIREPSILSSFKGTPQHIPHLEETSVGLKYRGGSLDNAYPEPTVLPSFTESFDQTNSGEMHRKKESASEFAGFRVSSSYMTPRSLPEYGSFKESCSPSSKSPQYDIGSSSDIYRQTGQSFAYSDVGDSQSYSCLQDSDDPCASVPSGYFTRKESSGNSSVAYSPAHSNVGVGLNYSTGYDHVPASAADGIYSEHNNFQNTRESSCLVSERTSIHEDVRDSAVSSLVAGSSSHPAVRDCLPGTDTNKFQVSSDLADPQDSTLKLKTAESSAQVSEDSCTQQDFRAIPCDLNTLRQNSDNTIPSDKTPTKEVSVPLIRSPPVDATQQDLSDAAVPSSPVELCQLSESPKSSKSVKSPVNISPIRSPNYSNSTIGSPGKYSSCSPTKVDSGASPSSQERIVIKMKLLHSDSGIEDIKHKRGTENANVTDPGLDNRNSVKYPMIKYTRWTIDSIINGRGELSSEEGTDKVCKEDESELVPEVGVEENSKTSLTTSPKRTSKRRSSESCNETKDTKLDTNKNLMKPLRITITNPLRSRISPDVSVDIKVKERKCDTTVVKSEGTFEEQSDDVQTEPSTGINVRRRSSRLEKESESQTHLFTTGKLKVKLLKSPTSTNTECLTNTTCASNEPCKNRKFNQSTDKLTAGEPGKGNDNSLAADVKKCSIVIKRIYTEDNSSCYSSSLCDKKLDLDIDQKTYSRRPKRKAALEATEKCHKFLKSLDTKDKKLGTIPVNGLVNKDKKLVSLQLTGNSTLHNNVPRCSVLLYDVFMNRRINQMVCPGCSRHYNSSDSVQVNINKATISLLCSSCQWLVVKDAHPREVDSMAPS